MNNCRQFVAIPSKACQHYFFAKGMNACEQIVVDKKKTLLILFQVSRDRQDYLSMHKSCRSKTDKVQFENIFLSGIWNLIHQVKRFIEVKHVGLFKSQHFGILYSKILVILWNNGRFFMRNTAYNYSRIYKQIGCHKHEFNL